MHPSDEIRGSISKKLANRRIVLGITGSIAAVETIKLARNLIRHGAEVIPVMTSSAERIIHPDAVEFATGKKPTIELTGETEHVSLCGQVRDPVDLLLISPCTANTISKIAHGIDDTPVTTFATTAIGSGLPIIIVPAMHISMYNHKILQKNIDICKKNGVIFVDPNIEGNKAKMADIKYITANVIRTINKSELHGKKILIIGGSTAESIDDIRFISNRSSGKTAISLATNAFFKGAEVELWYGQSKELIPAFINSERFESIKDIQKLLKRNNLNSFDLIFICASIADYSPIKQEGKIPSGKKELKLLLKPTPKIISTLRKLAPDSKIIGFKTEENEKLLKKRGFEILKDNNLDFVVANTIKAFGSDTNTIQILGQNGKTKRKKGSKENIASFILNYVTK